MAEMQRFQQGFSLLCFFQDMKHRCDEMGCAMHNKLNNPTKGLKMSSHKIKHVVNGRDDTLCYYVHNIKAMSTHSKDAAPGETTS